ncbi:MAG: adenylyl-sulfate kinase [Pseudomonadota bacterium]
MTMTTPAPAPAPHLAERAAGHAQAGAPDAPMAVQSNQAVNIHVHHGPAAGMARHRPIGQACCTVWLTGLSGAGKSTIAYALEQRLLDAGRAVCVLDGDQLRHHLNRDLGFSAADRSENIRRTAEVARMMNEAGLIVIAALISPLREDRDMAGRIIGPARFIETHVSTTLAVCEARDPKGLYAKARSGQLAQFTGISAPYQAPASPALTLDTAQLAPGAATDLLYAHLAQRFTLLGAQPC